MIITYKDNCVHLKNVADFSVQEIFDCGQAFRWNKCGDDEYEGVAFNTALKITQIGSELIFHETTLETFNNVWFNYFDFGTDYGKIKTQLSGDETMKKVISSGGGIRILKQDVFESVVSFIISQSNNIPRIKKIINILCESFGNKISYMGKEYYSFPTSEAIARADLSILHAGYRDEYIKYAAKAFFDDHSLSDSLLKMDYEDAKKYLMSFKGIGDKVSNCILLFGLGKINAFPIDVWMKRIMEQLYFKASAKPKEILELAMSKYGEYSGIAQQYLFYYAIKHKNEFKDALGGNNG